MSINSLKPIIISADEMKKTLAGYKPERSSGFHRESTRLADKAYEQALKESDYQNVILLSGGSASGKTEYLSAYLAETPAIIVDGTLPTLDGFSIKLKKALKAKKHVSVHAVIPDDLGRAFSAFLHRDRKYSDEHFYRTHSQSRVTLFGIVSDFPHIPIRIVESHTDADHKMTFSELVFKDRTVLVEYLQSIQYTEQEILKQVTL